MKLAGRRNDKQEKMENKKMVTATTDKRAWAVVAMLFLFMLINFADKAVLGLAAGPIIEELKLTHTQFGQVGSSFFILFSVSAILVGFIVNRVQTKWVLAAMALIWGVVQLPMLLVVGLPALMANRIILGAGEGPAYPVALHAIFKWFTNEKRPLPASVIAMGGAVGTGIVAPGIAYVILNYSWHVAFGMLGVLGLIWVVGWIAIGQEGPLSADSNHAADTGASAVSYGRLLTCRTFLGSVITGFSAYWLLTLAVVWLPSYLNKGAGYSPTEVSWIVTLPAFVQIIAIPGISWLSERPQVEWAFEPRVARCGRFAVRPDLGRAHLRPADDDRQRHADRDHRARVLDRLGDFRTRPRNGCRGHALVSQRGAMLGINNAVATTAGIFAPIVMGMVVDVGTNTADGFRTGFMIAGVLVVIGALIGLLLINPEADIARFARRDTLRMRPVTA